MVHDILKTQRSLRHAMEAAQRALALAPATNLMLQGVLHSLMELITATTATVRAADSSVESVSGDVSGVAQRASVTLGAATDLINVWESVGTMAHLVLAVAVLALTSYLLTSMNDRGLVGLVLFLVGAVAVLTRRANDPRTASPTVSGQPQESTAPSTVTARIVSHLHKAQRLRAAANLQPQPVRVGSIDTLVFRGGAWVDSILVNSVALLGRLPPRIGATDLLEGRQLVGITFCPEWNPGKHIVCITFHFSDGAKRFFGQGWHGKASPSHKYLALQATDCLSVRCDSSFITSISATDNDGNPIQPECVVCPGPTDA